MLRGNFAKQDASFPSGETINMNTCMNRKFIVKGD